MCEKPIIDVWKVENEHSPFPWRFSVEYKGIKHQFSGIPNYCKSKHSAICRAYYRAKWLTEGSFDEHYK